MKESPISALYDALLPSLKQHAPKDKTLELLRYYCDKIYQEGELNGRIKFLDETYPDLYTDSKDQNYTQINWVVRECREYWASQLERKEQ